MSSPPQEQGVEDAETTAQEPATHKIEATVEENEAPSTDRASDSVSPNASVPEQEEHATQAMQDEDSEDTPLQEPEEDTRPEVIPTATLAELYVRQGLLDRAIAVYLTLIEHDPTNPDIHKRLSELFVIKAQQDNP